MAPWRQYNFFHKKTMPWNSHSIYLFQKQFSLIGFMTNSTMFIAQSLVQVIMITTCSCKTCNRLQWPLIHLSAPICPCSASPPSCTVVGNEHIIKIPGRSTKCQRDLKWLCFSCCVSGTQWPLLSPHGSSIAVESWPGTNQAFLKADLRSVLPLRSLRMQWVKGNWHLITDQHPCSAWFTARLWLAHKGEAWQHAAWVEAGPNPALYKL